MLLNSCLDWDEDSIIEPSDSPPTTNTSHQGQKSKTTTLDLLDAEKRPSYVQEKSSNSAQGSHGTVKNSDNLRQSCGQLVPCEYKGMPAAEFIYVKV